MADRSSLGIPRELHTRFSEFCKKNGYHREFWTNKIISEWLDKNDVNGGISE